MVGSKGSMPGCLPRQSCRTRSSPSPSLGWFLALIQLALSVVLRVCLVRLSWRRRHVQVAPQ
eukprot:7769383-Heterocapsa_arctica.AAC.1